MKVLLFNGSPRSNGCTFTALSEIANILHVQGIETEILQIGNKPVQDCIGCNGCAEKGKCVFSGDPVNEWIEKAKSADGFIFGTPFITHTRRDEYSRQWIGCSMRAVKTSSINLPL